MTTRSRASFSRGHHARARARRCARAAGLRRRRSRPGDGLLGGGHELAGRSPDAIRSMAHRANSADDESQRRRSRRRAAARSRRPSAASSSACCRRSTTCAATPSTVSPDSSSTSTAVSASTTRDRDGDQRRRLRTAATATGPVMPLSDQVVEGPPGACGAFRRDRARARSP